MKKLLLFVLLISGAIHGAVIIKQAEDEDVLIADVATTADLATKLSTNAVTQTVTTSTTEVPSGAAVADAFLLVVQNSEVGATNGVCELDSSGLIPIDRIPIISVVFTGGERE